MAAMNEPAETAFRVNTLRAAPDGLAAELRAAGVEVTGPGSGGLLDPSDGLVVGLGGGEGRRPGSRPASWCPQSRGSQAVVALLDPRPGDRVLDLCAGPGIKTTAIAARLGDRGEIVSIEADPRRAAEVAELCARAGASCVRVEVGRRDRGRPRVWLRSHPLGPALHRPRNARLAARRALAQVGRRRRAARCAPAPDAGPRGAGAGAGRDARLLDLHDLGARERGVGGGARRVRRRRRARRPRRRPSAARLAPRSALPAAAAPARPDDGLLLRPLARGGLMADERDDPAPRLPGLRRAVAAPDPAPGPLPLRLLPAPLRARLRVPELRRAPDDGPDVRRRGPALPALRPLDAAAGVSAARPTPDAYSGARVAPSILSADFSRLGAQVARCWTPARG